MFEHPAYDSFWQEQALDRILAKRQPLKVPTMWSGPVGPGRHLRRLRTPMPRWNRKDKDNDKNSWWWARGGTAA
jgi:hypothetical protein